MLSQEFSHQITVEQNTPTRTSAGGVTDVWTTFATKWAKPAYRGGREMAAALQVVPTADVVFVVRAPCAATQKMRVKYGSRLFDVVGVDDLSDVDLVRLICKEGPRLGR